MANFNPKYKSKYNNIEKKKGIIVRDNLFFVPMYQRSRTQSKKFDVFFKI